MRGELQRNTRGGGHQAVFNRAATHALCGVAPVVFTAYMVWFSARHHALAYDFDRAFWPAGVRILHGLSPYPSPTSFAATHGIAFVYPALGAYLFATVGWMPRELADAVFTMVCIALACGTLWILEVRDWRVYGVALLWGPVVSGWQTANVSLLLAFALAVAWRYRERPVVVGSIVGLLISLKLFLWPVAGWLILTRRWKALGVTIAVGVATALAAWAVLGFDQLGPYLALVKAVTKVEELTAYTPLALALRLGLDRAMADAITSVLIILVALASLRSARNKDHEPLVLLGMIVISLLATPVVWRHYFGLLLVPLAIMRPRLSLAWTLPVLLVIVPVTGPAVWQLALTLATVTILVCSLFIWPSGAPRWSGSPTGSRGRARNHLVASGGPLAP